MILINEIKTGREGGLVHRCRGGSCTSSHDYVPKIKVSHSMQADGECGLLGTLSKGMLYFFKMDGEIRVILWRRKASQPLKLLGKKPWKEAERMAMIFISWESPPRRGVQDSPGRKVGCINTEPDLLLLRARRYRRPIWQSHYKTHIVSSFHLRFNTHVLCNVLGIPMSCWAINWVMTAMFGGTPQPACHICAGRGMRAPLKRSEYWQYQDYIHCEASQDRSVLDIWVSQLQHFRYTGQHFQGLGTSGQ